MPLLASRGPLAYGRVTQLRLGCSPLKSQCSREKCWQERKGCFIQETDNLGEGGLMSKTQLLTADQGPRAVKGGVSGVFHRQGEGATCRNSSQL